MTTLRPVTPLGIIAANLERLHAWALANAVVEPSIVSLLDETSRLASGLEPYIVACTSPQSAALQSVTSETVDLRWSALYRDGSTVVPLEAEMLSGHVEGIFLNFLVRATRARRILEIGLFTGYSALAMAEALPTDGTLLACEIDAYAASVARRSFERSRAGSKIRIEVRPAAETLEELSAAGERFDLIFIDADKASYATYFELIFAGTLLADDGLVCVDNTLLQGEPYATGVRTANGQAVADFNRLVAEDPRVEQVVLPIRDGVSLIRRVRA